MEQKNAWGEAPAGSAAAQQKIGFGQVTLRGGEAASIRRYMIIGERRISNYWWTIFVSLGSLGFLSTGINSYFTTVNYSQSPLVAANLIKASAAASLPLMPNPEGVWQAASLPFFPQGLLMSFYGSLGFLLSLYWWFLIFWNVGGGFNEFNKKDGLIRIFRWGYPGKTRKIDLIYSLKDVEAIKVELKQGLDPQRTIYLRLKGQRGSEAAASANPQGGLANREIPLTGIGQPLTLKDIEKQASELANFLQVSLEGL